MLKRIWGLLIICFSSFMLFAFLLSIGFLLFGDSRFSMGNLSPANQYMQICASILMPILFFALLKYGLRLFRKPKPNPFAGQKIEIDIMIKVKHTFQSYFKIMMTQLLDSVPLYPFLFIIGLGNLAFAISYFTGNPMELKEFPAIQLGMGLALTFIPFSFYFQLKKIFNSHPKLHEEVKYHFTNEFLEIKGESFESKLSWNTFHKFQELKNAFMIYESKATAIIIPKSSFENEPSITTVRTFLLSLQK